MSNLCLINNHERIIMKTNNANTTASSFLKIVRDNSFGRVKRKYRKPTAFIGYWEALARTK